MKKANLLKIVSAIIMAFVFTSCNKEKEYLSAMPNSPIIVAKMNVKNILDESEALKDNQIKNALKNGINELSGDSRTLMRGIIEKPEECGIDISQPAYFVMENLEQMRGLAIFAVNDEEKVKNTVSILLADTELRIPYTLASQSGVNTIEDEKGNATAAFDGTKFVVAFANGTADALEYMYLSDEEQDKSDKLMNFINEESDAALYADYGQLINLMAGMQRDLIGVDLSMFENTKLIAKLNFERGKASVTYRLEGNGQLEKTFNETVKTPSNDLVKYLPANTWASIQMGIKDLTAWESLLDENQSKQIDQLIEDLNNDLAQENIPTKLSIELLKSIKGDVILGVTPTIKQADQKEPQITFIAECQDKELFDAICNIVKEENKDLELIGNDVYSLGTNKRIDWDNHNWGEEFNYIRKGYDYYFGYADNKMFVIPENIYKNNVENGKMKEIDGNLKNNKDLFNIIDGKYAGGIDINGFLSFLEKEEDLGRDGKEVINYIRKFKSISIEIKNSNEYEMVLSMNDNETEILKIIKDLCVQAVVAEYTR